MASYFGTRETTRHALKLTGAALEFNDLCWAIKRGAHELVVDLFRRRAVPFGVIIAGALGAVTPEGSLKHGINKRHSISPNDNVDVSDRLGVQQEKLLIIEF